MTAAERRLKVRDAYRKYIGRNHYSQAKRTWCVKPYKDGKYYSDCSSSVSYAYREAGEDLGMIMRTTDMYASKKFSDVAVKIVKGVIQNPEVLEIGDILLFAGNDTGRKKWGYVGHVEMVGEISAGKVTLYGHGSGLAKKHEMNAYCRDRYASKSGTPLGRRLLIKVRRKIWDGEGEGPGDEGIAPTDVLRNGDKGAAVKAMQEGLIRLGFDCGCWGADGDFGDATEMAVRDFQQRFGLQVTGVFGQEDRAMMDKGLAALDKPVTDPGYVEIFGGNCYVRLGPGVEYEAIGVAYEGSRWPYTGIMYENGWFKVEWKGKEGWVSPKYGRLVE